MTKFNVSVYLASLLCLGATIASGDEIVLTPFARGAAVASSTVTIEGREMAGWKTSPKDRVYSFKSAGTPLASPSGELYLAVTYLDQGYGRLTVTYNDAQGKSAKPDKYTRAVLSDSGKWVTSYQRLSRVGPSGLAEVQVGIDKSQDNVLVIAKVTLQAAAFTDAHFKYLLEEKWKRPYDGASVPDIDNKTLKGKVMVGYQGWFRTPNDPYDRGWFHWGDMSRGAFSTDMWPDISEYPVEALDKAGDVKLKSGGTAYLFSSGWPEVVRIHFSWMRKHNIDGAFLQRFLTDGSFALNGRAEWVLGNVREAANLEGRIWAIEYDISGIADAKLLEMIKTDWAWLVDSFGIRRDPGYAHEGGKPVVFVWGMGVPSRNITPETANAVVDFLKNDPAYGGNHVIGGIGGPWRKADAAWQEHYRKYDGILVWMSKSYAEDVADFKKMGVDYYPHVWPGFSWANLKHLPGTSTTAYNPREGGRFYETLYSQAAKAGGDRLFVGMFDEYDESTAIMPMSDDAPPTPERPGVNVKFYSNPQWNGKESSMNQPQVMWTFDAAALPKGIPAENYSMRWEGILIPPADGEYRFEIDGAPGDAAVLWINEKKALDVKKLGESKDKFASVTMTSGQRVIFRLDYMHASAPGGFQLVWQGPSIERQPVPAAALIDAWGRFITNDGRPADWWLRLTGEAKKMINGQRSPEELSVK